jgi:golgi-specific brefeldin A-resistance guanine nucleotide exchange factor 1
LLRIIVDINEGVNNDKEKMFEDGILLFNEKPPKGIEFCIVNRLIKRKGAPNKVAKFLLTPGLSKFAIG